MYFVYHFRMDNQLTYPANVCYISLLNLSNRSHEKQKVGLAIRVTRLATKFSNQVVMLNGLYKADDTQEFVSSNEDRKRNFGTADNFKK